jgi:hypothetical protein
VPYSCHLNTFPIKATNSNYCSSCEKAEWTSYSKFGSDIKIDDIINTRGYRKGYFLHTGAMGLFWEEYGSPLQAILKMAWERRLGAGHNGTHLQSQHAGGLRVCDHLGLHNQNFKKKAKSKQKTGLWGCLRLGSTSVWAFLLEVWGSLV